MTQVCVSCHPSHGSGNTGNSGNARDWQLCWQCCTLTILAWPPRPGRPQPDGWRPVSCTLAPAPVSSDPGLTPEPEPDNMDIRHQTEETNKKTCPLASLSSCLRYTNKYRMMIRVIRHNVYHCPWNQINYNAGYHQYPDISTMTHIVTAQEDNVTDTQCTVMLPLLSLDKD